MRVMEWWRWNLFFLAIVRLCNINCLHSAKSADSAEFRVPSTTNQGTITLPTASITTTGHSQPSDPEPEPERADCDDACTHNVQMPNFCDYAANLWDDASTPLDERNNIGMAKYLTSAHILKASKLVQRGKAYKLAYTATNSMPAFGTRTWFTALRGTAGVFGTPEAYYEYDEHNQETCGAGWGYLDQRLMTSAVGNSGTQFDALGHIFYVNGEPGDQRNYLFFNGFRGSDILREDGVSYIAVDELPPFITRAILLDVAGFVGVEVLPEAFQVDTSVVEDVLQHQGMSVDDIEVGDVILLYTGWAEAHWYGDADYYYAQEPGFTLDTVLNIFGPKQVLLLGADNFGVEYVPVGDVLDIPIHVHWIVCHGGFLYENLRLIEWVTDARNGEAPYQGAFYYSPAQIEGGVAGLGTPMVVV